MKSLANSLKKRRRNAIGSKLLLLKTQKRQKSKFLKLEEIRDAKVSDALSIQGDFVFRNDVLRIKIRNGLQVDDFAPAFAKLNLVDEDIVAAFVFDLVFQIGIEFLFVPIIFIFQQLKAQINDMAFWTILS
jgi:hypothetical protein